MKLSFNYLLLHVFPDTYSKLYDNVIIIYNVDIFVSWNYTLTSYQQATNFTVVTLHKKNCSSKSGVEYNHIHHKHVFFMSKFNTEFISECPLDLWSWLVVLWKKKIQL